jgi:hypothetical protein
MSLRFHRLLYHLVMENPSKKSLPLRHLHRHKKLLKQRCRLGLRGYHGLCCKISNPL